MSTTLAPILFATLLWWASTGVVLHLVNLAERMPRLTLGGAIATLALAVGTLHVTASDEGATAVYLAFTAAIAAWGVQELAFLAGWITGPWRAACPPGLGGWSRAGYALSAIVHHEVALLATGAAIAAATLGGPNRTGLATFAILLAMRVSAKLNVFLGVSNRSESFLPHHLRYLASFFAERPMNPLFPISVTAITLLLATLASQAALADGGPSVALTLLATLVGLALLEHWFMVLPLPAEALWSWGLKNRRPAILNRTDTLERPVLRPAVAGTAIAVTNLERGQEP